MHDTRSLEQVSGIWVAKPSKGIVFKNPLSLMMTGKAREGVSSSDTRTPTECLGGCKLSFLGNPAAGWQRVGEALGGGEVELVQSEVHTCTDHGLLCRAVESCQGSGILRHAGGLVAGHAA